MTAGPLPAGAMSAVVGEPNHLLERAHRRGLAASAANNLPRGVHGEYLEDVLATAADGPCGASPARW